MIKFIARVVFLGVVLILLHLCLSWVTTNLLVVPVINTPTQLQIAFNTTAKSSAIAFANGEDPEVDRNSWRKLEFNLVYIQHIKQIPQLIVLGSSHSVFINSAMLAPNSIFNHYTLGGGRKETIAVYSEYKAKGIVPKKILVGVDIWFLQHGAMFDAYWPTTALSPIDTLQLLKHIAQQYLAQLIKTMQNVVNVLAQKLLPYAWVKPFEFPMAGTDIQKLSTFMMKDGSRIPCGPQGCGKFTNKDAREVARHMQSWFHTPFDRAAMNEFEAFIQQMQQDGVEVALFIAPLHPIVYEEIKDEPLAKLFVDYFYSLATKYHLAMIGSYDPSQCQLLTSDFGMAII